MFCRCVTENNVDEQCPSGNDRCEFRIKNGESKAGCTTADEGKLLDIEYRMNIVEKTQDAQSDANLGIPLKCNYICRVDLCNSMTNFDRVCFNCLDDIPIEKISLRLIISCMH